MESKDKLLEMSFEPRTIEHLGVKMYSHVPPALAELIANAYDACATKVHVKLYNQPVRRIVVEDNGTGMTFDEINNFFLRIGRNRREEKQKSQCQRSPTGKKGLGKLALFGIGNKISITTIKDKEQVKFTLDYKEISSWEGKNYTPSFEESQTDLSSGTKFILDDLKRKSAFPLEEYAISISKLFNFKDKDFEVYISLDNSDSILIDNKLKYQNISPEFEWTNESLFKLFESDYVEKDKIVGKLFTTEKPLRPGLRGVTLFANGRMVNSAEFFGKSESSHFFSYLTGWLDIDFIDKYEQEDLISTDRQSIDWEHPISKSLQEFLQNCLSALERDWRIKRKQKRRDSVQEKTNVNIESWLGTIPENIKGQLEKLLIKVDESELSTQDQTETIQSLYSLVPEYPQYHWRHLNENIKSVSREDYERGDYIRAAQEGIKLYEKEVKSKSGINRIGVDLMSRSFGPEQEPLKVTPNISDSDKNVEKGQKHMSMGIMSGFRNPSMHEPKSVIYPGIYNDSDCLDLLSMMSYLFNKLDQARNITND